MHGTMWLTFHLMRTSWDVAGQIRRARTYRAVGAQPLILITLSRRKASHE